MSEHPDDAILSETLERIRRAELATVIHPPGTPEHARAVARLTRSTQQLRRLETAESLPDRSAAAGSRGMEPGPIAG